MIRAILLTMLVISNVFWAFQRVGRPVAAPQRSTRPPTLTELQQREDELGAELSRLQPPTPPRPGPRAAPPGEVTYWAAQELQQRWREEMNAARGKRKNEILADRLTEAFASGDPIQVRAALVMLCFAPRDFPNTRFHADIAKQLTFVLPRTRYLALRALTNMRPFEEDLAAAVELSRDRTPSVRGMAGRLLLVHAGESCEGEIAAEIVRLLGDSNGDVRQTVLDSSWQWNNIRRLSPELERVLLAQSGPARRRVFRHILVPLDPKSEAVVGVLTKALSGLGEESRRAPEALLRGVPERLQPRVTRAALKIIEARDRIPQGLLRLVEKYGGKAEMGTLERLCRAGHFTEHDRRQAEKIIGRMQRHGRRAR